MNIRQEIAVAGQSSRMLRPANVVDVLRLRALQRRPASEVVAKHGDFTRGKFADARSNPNALPVVIPSHNEEQALPATLVALARAGNVLPVVVDNRSTDATAEVADNMGAIVLEQPSGRKMAATKMGLKYVLHSLIRSEAVCLDADTLPVRHYPEAMRERMDSVDGGRGVAVFGSMYRMFGKSRAADLVTSVTNFRDNIRRERNGDLPVPHGSSFALRFDAGGLMEAGLMALPDNNFTAAEGVPDDVAIFRTVVAAGAAVVGSVDPNSFVLTESRIESMAQVRAMHGGASWDEVTAASYARQYKQQ